ncbi:hypothetical protein [Actinopolymorpha alba]|uniref:hypothetical protein n=1 Tax=Actinopolymorpha alba TaxID=533267 RepID=UPI00036612B6|nr:hypothetical protein [Actinopolymorpha alba]
MSVPGAFLALAVVVVPMLVPLSGPPGRAVAALGVPASQEAISTNTLLVSELPAANGGQFFTVLRLPPVRVAAGQPMYLQARLAARSNVPRGPLMEMRTICPGAGGSPTTDRNHDGQAYGVESETGRWLMVPPATGTFTCELRGRAATSLDPAVAKLILDPRLTVLSMVAANPGATQWTDPVNRCVGTVPDPTVPQCVVARPIANVLQKTVPLPSSATYANVGADVQLSREYGAFPGGNAMVRLSLRATPVDVNEVACAPRRETMATQTITSNLHHVKVNLTLTKVGVNQSGTCGRSLKVGVVVASLVGNPVTIHNSAYSNAFLLPA